MGLAVIRAFGAPDYGAMKGQEGLVFHTPENTGPTVEEALATAEWQAAERNTSGGSYHGILGHDDELGPMSDWQAWVLVKSVPFNRIAGSMTSRRDAIWAPGRFPWLAQLLSDAAYADPNAYLHALSLSGKAAWWSAKLSTPAGYAEVRGAIVALARWVRRLEREFKYDSVLSLHRHWQTNRSDPDGLNFADLVLDEYEQLGQAQEPAPVDYQSVVAGLEADVADAQRDVRRLRRRIRVKNGALDASIAAAQEGRAA